MCSYIGDWMESLAASEICTCSLEKDLVCVWISLSRRLMSSFLVPLSLPPKRSHYLPIRSRNNGMKIWYGIGTFNFHSYMNICFTNFEVIFLLMDHFSIFHKGNNIEINLVVHSELDIFPVFVCYWRQSCSFSTHIQTTPWFQLTTINYLALNQIFSLWFQS